MEPIITYQKTLEVINDVCKLLQVENINEKFSIHNQVIMK